MGSRLTRRGGPADQNIKWRLSEHEVAEFLTKTERKATLLDRCYLLFEEYLQEKTCVYI